MCASTVSIGLRCTPAIEANQNEFVIISSLLLTIRCLCWWWTSVVLQAIRRKYCYEHLLANIMEKRKVISKPVFFEIRQSMVVQMTLQRNASHFGGSVCYCRRCRNKNNKEVRVEKVQSQRESYSDIVVPTNVSSETTPNTATTT
jgi:hypothetical protein